MIKKVSIEEVVELSANTKEFPVLFKEENDTTKSAVCLKKMPEGYLLGISSETKKVLELYYSNHYSSILDKCKKCSEKMLKTGFPF